jgi:hypothetical protein
LQLANPQIGRMYMDYEPVDCQPPGNITFHVYANRGPGRWVKISVEVMLGSYAMHTSSNILLLLAPAVCPSGCPFVRLSIRPSVRPSVRLSV